MRVVPVPQLADNYGYLIIDEASGEAAIVDVAEAKPVLEAAKAEGVRITAILSTHHHFDHVGGNQDLINALGVGALRVFGYAADAERIPGISDPLDDGAEFNLGSLHGRALFIPAHTSGHVAYYFENDAVVFTGDTLFAAGCGRMFEGDAAQMKSSLERLASLPDDTRVYCGHEYTQGNLAFAATLEPGNERLQEWRKQAAALRALGEPTVPTTIGLEKAVNPFLRSDNEELRRSVQAKRPGTADDDVAIFAATRSLKDEF